MSFSVLAFMLYYNTHFFGGSSYNKAKYTFFSVRRPLMMSFVPFYRFLGKYALQLCADAQRIKMSSWVCEYVSGYCECVVIVVVVEWLKGFPEVFNTNISQVPTIFRITSCITRFTVSSVNTEYKIRAEIYNFWIIRWYRTVIFLWFWTHHLM